MKKNISPDLKRRFTKLLLKWDELQNTRQMPWKREKNPYRIWLSEIILQQTRVEQGLSYYENFIQCFPDVTTLANASEQKIFKQWEGLGYYSRCRNLISTAKRITEEFNAVFPSTYEQILSLKGIGPYTAAAISSFAFNLPYAVLDGNVFRVLARIFGIPEPIDSAKGKKFFAQLSTELLDKKEPGRYNQAIMDFGAVICKPVPKCGVCVFRKHCFAFQHDVIEKLPVKEKKTAIRKRWFYYLVIEIKGRIAITQRTQKDIWQQLFEFPLVEASRRSSTKKVLELAETSGWLSKDKYEVKNISRGYRQQLSHQIIAGRFLHILTEQKTIRLSKMKCVDFKKIGQYAFPQFINQYLHDDDGSLRLK
jgi:A/G-specific adenine glycosylase